MRISSFAEKAGFEPAIEFPLCRFSKPVPSATRPPLLFAVSTANTNIRQFCFSAKEILIFTKLIHLQLYEPFGKQIADLFPKQ